MCGVCGFVVEKGKGAADWSHVLDEMTRVLAHRGPDRDGHYYSKRGDTIIGLGHRRLSIIDLSEKADQPMGNEDGSVQVVFNGEIYNYQDLTKDLKRRGHIFRSQSDTEVIVHLYEDLGENCISNLDGMFAFALWDDKNARLLLARDRLGIKPIFYSFSGGAFCFASEIKALLRVPWVSREIDLEALDAFITYGYIPGSKTIFKSIKKLPPASYLTFENRQISIRPYWSIQYEPKNSLSPEELNEKLLDLFTKSIERHLISDVPLGAFLSGGVDSSIVVAMMTQVMGTKVETFSLGYGSGGEDELAYAALVARHCGTHHHEFRVDPGMTEILPQLLWYLDEPFFDNSIIPTYYISKLARDNVKVILSGDGGDEIFGGYEWTRRHQYAVAYGMVPGLIRAWLKKLDRGIHPEDDYGKGFLSKAQRFFNDLNADVETGFIRRTTVSHPFRQMFYSQALINELGGFDATDHQRRLFSEPRVTDEREKMLYADTKSYLPDDCLFKVDRMSMAHGLEVRVPFLDRGLVEFASRIPFEYKIRGFTSKYILKKTFAPYLPREILKQRKQGFTIPISAWLRGDLGDLASRILLSDSLRKRDLFEEKRLKWMLEAHRNGRQELGHRIWSLVVFEIWARLYLDEEIDSAPNLSLEEMQG